MKIKCTKGTGSIFTTGNIYEISDDGKLTCNDGFTFGPRGSVDAMLQFMRFNGVRFDPAVDSYELHITCNDGKTTNAVYKVNGKIEKRTEAKCSPSDTFDFATGAQTAFDRVFPKATPTRPIAPQEDKPQPIKLYCVKDFNTDSEHWLTKGKTYDFESNGKIVFDNGWDNSIINRGETFKAFRRRNPNVSACLVPLVSRPAKVGEWITPTTDCSRYYRKNILYKVKSAYTTGRRLEDGSYISHCNYLVLDGYSPEPEKEPEPVYYSGKVVCTENENTKGFWTVGKVYEFKNGYAMTDCGVKSPVYGAPINALSEYAGVKFIPYLGE